MGKVVKYDGEEFELSEPKNCQIEVVGVGLTGQITIHEATGKFRESVLGWGSDQPTMQAAVLAVCRRMLLRSKGATRETLCKQMADYYEDLESGG
ncbi:MAG: hypothetical protein OXH70_16795 [Acidobacteria bacterium]|nr:hypothetical protein [Acidobacteriota bacterium]MCY3970268.1 hypothetical protein [Acidobacteriota bacterium]